MIRRIIKSKSPNHQKKARLINKPKNKHYCRRRGEKESGGDFILLILTKEELINPREIKSLIKVAKIFGIKNLKIITWNNYMEFRKRNGSQRGKNNLSAIL